MAELLVKISYIAFAGAVDLPNSGSYFVYKI